MRKMNKKGFTIVELVIVIAVIAILAAVLIPTFVSLVNKANEASDTAVAKNMNTALAQYSAANGAPETFDEVLAAIEEAGYVLANLNAKAEGNLYGWDKVNNQIVYINAEGEVIYQNTDFDPANVQFIVASGSITVPEGFNSSVVDMSKPAGPKALKAALEEGRSVTLDADITLSSVIEITGEATIDLNGHEIDATAVEARPFSLDDGAKLTIKAEGQTVDCGLYGLVNIKAGADAEVVIDGGNIVGDLDNGALIKVRAGEGNVKVVLNNVTYTDASDDSYIVNAAGFKGNLTLEINGGTYKSHYGIQVYGTATIKNATIETEGYAVDVTKGGTATIEGCTIKVGTAVDNTAPAACVAVDNASSATVKNCNLDNTNAPAYDVYPTGGTIVAEGNTLTVSDSNIFVDRTASATATSKITVDGEVVYEVVVE